MNVHKIIFSQPSPFSCPPCLEYLRQRAMILLKFWCYISHLHTYLKFSFCFVIDTVDTDDSYCVGATNHCCYFLLHIMATVLVFYSYWHVYCAFLVLICYYYYVLFCSAYLLICHTLRGKCSASWETVTLVMITVVVLMRWCCLLFFSNYVTCSCDAVIWQFTLYCFFSNF